MESEARRTRGAQIVEWLPVVALAASLTMCSVKLWQMQSITSAALRSVRATSSLTASSDLPLAR